MTGVRTGVRQAGVIGTVLVNGKTRGTVAAVGSGITRHMIACVVLLVAAWSATASAAPLTPAAGPAGPTGPATRPGQVDEWKTVLAGGRAADPTPAAATPAPSPAPAAVYPGVNVAPAGPTPGPPTVAATQPAAATTNPPPAPAVAAGKFDKVPIQRAGGDAAKSNGSGSSASSGGASDAGRVVAALAAVLGLIFFLKWGSRKLFALPAAGRSTGTVRVLTRSVLAPRQQVMLLQVGRRVLVVADSGSQMTNLCAITDPDEVAALLGQIRSEKEAASANAFGGLLGRVRKGFGGANGNAGDEPEPVDGTGGSTAKAERAQLLGPPDDDGASEDEHSDEHPSDDVAADRPAGPADVGFNDADAEAAVAAARDELDGLREKLREVSRRFVEPSPPAAGGEKGNPKPNGEAKPNGETRPNGESRRNGKRK